MTHLTATERATLPFQQDALQLINDAYEKGLRTGRKQAADALPAGSTEILAWLARHGLSATPGVGVVLAAVRADLTP